MLVNLYNSVKITGYTNEQPLSIARSLNEWGDRLIGTSRIFHDGRSYSVNLETQEVALQESTLRKPVRSLWSKIQDFVGIALKKTAYACSQEIKACYELTCDPQNSKSFKILKIAYGMTWQKPVDQKPVVQENGSIDTFNAGFKFGKNLGDCCIGCLSCCEVAVKSIPLK
jgi:hypothetical protein